MAIRDHLLGVRHWDLGGLALLALAIARGSAAESGYDPLRTADLDKTEAVEATVHDESRKREIPIRVYLPAEKSPASVVLFSHGLGGSRMGNAFMGKHWAARGYVAVFLQHPGSDTSVWQGKPLKDRMPAMQEAAGLQNFLLRAKDLPVVLDQLESWNEASDHALSGRIDMKRIGMSGHSFGAVTTQAVCGQSDITRQARFAEPRLKAAIAFSPSGPKRGDAKQAFGSVKIPWLLMTGTKDVGLVGDTDVASRLSVFPALPPGNKYEVVLHNAEHSAFTDRALPGDMEPRNPNHHRVILALSTAFWDAYLRDDAAAKAWLEGNGPAGVMEKDDRWQRK